MRKRSIALVALFVFGLISCADEESDVVAWSRKHYRSVLDSIGSSSLGCYSEPKGFFIIDFDKQHDTMARKLTYRRGFPLYIDSLSFIKPDEFHSKREDITYLIKDTCVLGIQYVKIFHPNSNLKGQTPWVQPYVNSYKRLDK